MSALIVDRPSALPGGTVLIVPFFDGDALEDLPERDVLNPERIDDLRRESALYALRYHCTMIFGSRDTYHVLFVAAKERETFDALAMLRCAAAGARWATLRGFGRIAVLDRGYLSAHDFGHAAVEGCVRGSYDPGLQKTRTRGRAPLESVHLVSNRSGEDLQDGASLGLIVGESSKIARDLVTLPANEVTPSTLAVRAEALASEHGLASSILTESDLRDLGMRALLAVAAGSEEPPCVIVMRYGDPSARVRLALVGKGITFDSGGLSLKTAEGMEHMKSDMAGAAAVIAGIVAIARLRLPNVSVTAYVGATENMPGGHSMRPGDIVTALSGETIEVLNTDAEGRLVLADVLAYAESQGATHIVDLATLTGGAVTALGHVTTLAAGKPSAWVNVVVGAAVAGLERTWPMPLFPEYRDIMWSEVADIKNSGGRAASPLTAAAFLSDFVRNAAWAHLDIAGTAWLPKREPYAEKGATGAGVGTIVNLAALLSRGDRHEMNSLTGGDKL